MKICQCLLPVVIKWLTLGNNKNYNFFFSFWFEDSFIHFKVTGSERVLDCIDFTNMVTLRIEMSKCKHFFLDLKRVMKNPFHSSMAFQKASMYCKMKQKLNDHIVS